MDERVAKDSDELLRMIQEDELEDHATVQEFMKINDYARFRSIAPQRVHYYIRNKRLKKVRCACGSFVVRIADADLALGFAKENEHKEDD